GGEAAPHLEHRRARRPGDPEVLVRLAFARNGLGDADGSLRLLDALLASHPDYPPALTARGQLALQAGQREDAERWLRRALELSPFDRQAHYLLFQCLQQQGKDEEAEQEQARLKRVEADIVRLIEISNKEMAPNPHDPALHHEVASLLMNMGHEELGVRWLHSALRQDPKYRPSHLALAEYYERTGDAAQAAEHRRLAGP